MKFVPELTADDRLTLIDISNRINFAFDDWDVDTLTNLMDPDLRMAHPRGDVVGLEGFARFLEVYRPLTIGCRRHALNHVVTADSDGTAIVTSYLLILRVEESGDASGQVLPASSPLPAIVLSSRVTDTFRRGGDSGWRLLHRGIDGIVETPSIP